MKLLVCLSSVVLLAFCVDSISGALGVCAGGGYCKQADFKTIGCYRDVKGDRALPNYIYNERDPTHSNYGGRSIEWYNWNDWLPGFICRCAGKAKEQGYDIFGVQFWGECWAGHKSANLWNKHSTINHCYGENYKLCEQNERFCMGANSTNMIYEIVDSTCSVDYEPVGCYNDHHGSDRPLGDYVMNDRDPSHSLYSGHSISWMNWDTYMPGFNCRCAQKAKELGHKYFGTQYYGECWTSANGKYTFGRDGSATSCINRCYKPCRRNEQNCIGEHFTNYVYHIKEPSCDFTLTEVGCYHENPENRVLNNHIFDAVDPTSVAFGGELLLQRPWNTFFPDFLCKCARVAKAKGHSVIGINNKGSCYSSSVSDSYSTLGDSGNCAQGKAGVACTSGGKNCAGMDKESNFVYLIA